MYVYRTFPQGDGMYLYAVGFYTPDGKWEAESDWNTAEEAAIRVHYLNGGN